MFYVREDRDETVEKSSENLKGDWTRRKRKNWDKRSNFVDFKKGTLVSCIQNFNSFEVNWTLRCKVIFMWILEFLWYFLINIRNLPT